MLRTRVQVPRYKRRLPSLALTPQGLTLSVGALQDELLEGADVVLVEDVAVAFAAVDAVVRLERFS